MTADAFQSISSWKYTELLQDNLTLALVDENDDDGCLLRETWPEIEGRLSDMVAKRLQAVPQGPNPSFDSSYVIRGHRVIRCLDGFSKIFLEDCLDQIGSAWRGLRIRLVHASEIPCPEKQRILPSTEDLEQTEEINQTEEAEQTVENSFGWIVPRGAQISDAAIQEIQFRKLHNPNGQQNRFLLKDGSTVWRIIINQDQEVRIIEHISPAGENLNQLAKGDQMSQLDEISEVNSFGWIVPPGAHFSDTAIQQIKNSMIKAKGKRMAFLVFDGLKGWRVKVRRGDQVRIRPYTRSAVRKEPSNEIENTKQSMAIDQSEQRQNIEQTKETLQTMLMDETEDIELTDGTKQTEDLIQPEERNHTEKQQTVENSFGWIVPLGAQISDAAIQEIQFRKLYNPNGQQNRFLLKDGSTIWRIIINQDHEVRILEHIPPAEEVNHVEEGEQMSQEDEISEVNSFGWIVPPGAQFSDTAIQQITNFKIKANGKRVRFLVFDGLNAWKVQVSRGDRVLIRQYTGSAVRKEPSNEVENPEQSMVIDQSEQREDIEKTMLIDEQQDAEGSKQAKEMIQTAEINNTEEISQANEEELAEVNHFGWTVPLGAQFSDIAIEEIKNGMIKAKGKRRAFLVFDGLKAWRVKVRRGDQVRIRPYTRSAVRKEPSKEIEEGQLIEEIDHTEDREQMEVDKSLVINAKQDTKELSENNAFSGDNQILISHYVPPAVKEKGRMVVNDEDGISPQNKSLLINPKDDTDATEKLSENNAFSGDNQLLIRKEKEEPSEEKGAIKVNDEDAISPRAEELEDEMGQPVVNSLGWVLVGGAQPSEAAILEIQPRVLKGTTKSRYRFLVKDGLKTWRVTLNRSQTVRIGPYNPPVDKTKELKPMEDEDIQLTDQLKSQVVINLEENGE
ncbi:uncharacterized protein [Drosophila takahashii]